MYEKLAVSVPVTNDHLTDYFKPESMGLPTAPQETEHPRSDVTIETDSRGVPHIIGTTRAAAEFGAGYAGAEQRLFDDAPSSHVGSSYIAGWYGYVEKTLNMVLGNPVTRPYSVLRCADGTMAGCCAALEKSLQDAVTQLGPDPSTWNADESADTIQFQAVGLNSVPAMPWQNRPTFQQVVEVSSHRPA